MVHYHQKNNPTLEFIPSKGADAMSAAIATKTLQLLARCLAEAATRTIAEARESSTKKKWPTEPTGEDLLGYIAWGEDGGRHCD
jgi:hypothetical protein